MQRPGSQSDKTQVNEADRLRARLVLAATRIDEQEVQVSIDDLIALREGRLSADHRQRVLQLLDSCPECYEEWLALNRFLDDEARLSDAGRKGWLVRGMPFVGTRTITAAAAAVVLAVSVMLFFVQAPDIGTRVDRAYASAEKYSLLPAHPGGLITLDETHYAFGGSGDNAIARTAFAAGAWSANHVLQGDAASDYPEGLLPPSVTAASFNDEPWHETQWSVYTDTARWLVLVVEVCKGPEPENQPFWQEQYAILNRIRNKLRALGKYDGFHEVMSGRLGRMDDAYSKLAEGGATGRPCALIERETRGLLGSVGQPDS